MARTPSSAPPTRPGAPEPTGRALGMLIAVLAAVAGLAVAVGAAPLAADLTEPRPLRTTVEAADDEGWRVASLRGSAAGVFEPMRFRPGAGGMVEIHPAWVDAHLITADVPLLSGPVRCHRVLIPQLRGALGELEGRGLGDLIDPEQYGGCHVPRHILFNPERTLSLHAWGLAVDLNVSGNEYGAEPTMDPRVVEVFSRWGFAWGGDWRTPDGMHFELLEVLEEPPAA